jgi:hypothetical protein
MARKRANDYDDKRQAILDRSAVLSPRTAMTERR